MPSAVKQSDHTSAARDESNQAAPRLGRDLTRIPVTSSGAAAPRLPVGATRGADERNADAAADSFHEGRSAGSSRTATRGLVDPAPPVRAVPRSVVEVIGEDSGYGLEPSVRRPIEAHLRADLSTTRVHTGTRPAASARELGANAYTVGNHVVLGAQYSPSTERGQRVLVHELAHVAQQQATSAPAGVQLQMQAEGAAREGASVTEQAPAAWQTILEKAIVKALELPATGLILAARFGEGIGEAFADEGPEAIAKLVAHVAKMTPGDYLELVKGYLLGLVEGIVSPVTDLFGLAVFAETVLNAMYDLAKSAFNKAGQLGSELKAVIDAGGRLKKGAGEVWHSLKKAGVKQVVLQVLSLASSIPAKAGKEARKLGQSAGYAILEGLESPWQEEKPETEAPEEGFHPLGTIEATVSGALKRLVGKVPWAKLGEKFGYAIGFLVIQVVLLIFSEGIGNAIEEAAAALGRFASTLGRLGKVVGTGAKFLAEIGRAISWVEGLIAKVTGAALKPLEKLLKPILEPFGELLESLQKLLQKLLGVAKKEGPQLEEAAAKALAQAEKHVPEHVPASVAHKPPEHVPGSDVPPHHAPHTQTPPPATHTGSAAESHAPPPAAHSGSAAESHAPPPAAHDARPVHQPQSPARPPRTPQQLADEQRLIEKMAREREAEQLRRLRPEVRDIVDKSKLRWPDGRSMKEIAIDNPKGMNDLYREWKAAAPKSEFDAYARARMRAEHRGGYGEMTEAFERGAKGEIVVAPPGKATATGIDLITYDRQAARIKLIDNKAVTRNVGKVSALEENLPHNLQEATDWMKTYARRPGVAPEIKQIVVPRLEAAQADIERFVQTLPPPRNLKSPAVQKEFTKILDKHGIDRVVTTSGARPGVRMTGGLAERWSSAKK